jgi:muramidase (phage lysozyme)
MLDMIAYAEGTRGYSKDGYNVKFGFGLFGSCDRHPNDCVRMSNGDCSTAAGRYQFLIGTWSGLGYPNFWPENQDRGGVRLITEKRRVALPGDRLLSATEFGNAMDRLSLEWASLPGSPYGQGGKSLDQVWSVYRSGGSCSEPVGSDGCTATERANAAKFGCACVNHKGEGGMCPGDGCTEQERANAAKFGCQCVDHKGSGGMCEGTGCTAAEAANCAKVGCGCADHKCGGGFCGGSGCTAREEGECKDRGMRCVNHQCERHPTTYEVHTGDFNGDGKTDVLTWSPNAGGGWSDWASLELSTGSGFTSGVWAATTPAHARNGNLDRRYVSLSGDFDGNGRTDIATVSPNGGGGWANWIAMELSNGSGFGSGTWKASTPGHMRNGGNAAYSVYAGDFNGDGRSDLATLSPTGGGGWGEWMAMELSTGNGFTSSVWKAGTPLHMRNGGNTRAYTTVKGDFNGDGRTDLATVSPNAGGGWANWVAVDLSTGSGFTAGAWKASTPAHMRNGGGSANYQVLAEDFNGDGRTDLATVSQNAGGGWANWIAVELSTGSGFTSAAWSATTPAHMRNGGGNAVYRVVAGDVNADGRADLVTLSPNGGGGWANWMAVELSTGSGFSSHAWSSGTPQHIRNGSAGRDYRVLVGDFEGNERADIAVLSPNGGGGWANWLSVNLSTGSAFTTGAWSANTPAHMRNGMR